MATETDLLRLSLGDVIAHHARTTPDRIAIIGGEREWTYDDLAAVVHSATRRVADLNAGPHPLVAVEADQRSTLAVAVCALSAVCTVAPIAGDLPEAGRAALLDRLAPAAVFNGRVLVDGDLAATGAASLSPGFDDAAIVFSTSGSSAEPKLVPNTHRNLWASASAARRGQALGAEDRCMALGSMAHTLGVRAVLDAIWCGATVVIPEALTVDCLAHHLRAHRPTCVVAPPPALHLVAAALEHLEPSERELATAVLRFVRSGSAALRPAHADQLRKRMQVPVLHGYALTEAGKIACTSISEVAPPGSVGRPLGVEVWIDHDEIVVRGDAVAPGYFDDGHRSASAFVDGWFRTGDAGRVDADGNLYVLGRRDEVVSRGGELLSLGVLEEALEAHPGVRGALAAAIEHRSLGTDVVIAYVSEGSSSLDVAELRAFLQTRVPASQVPTRFVPMDELPLAPSGKPSRRELASMVGVGDDGGHDSGANTRPPADLQAWEVRMASLWSDVLVLDAEPRPDDDFFALGADSLHLVELASMLSDAFGVEVVPGELIGFPTLRTMSEFVCSVPGRPHRPLLLPLRDGTRDRVPLYVVPGVGGTLANLQPFIRSFAGGRRVLGFEAPGLYHSERPLRRVSELAALYVDTMLADVGDEPFAIIGYSFGAVVVQEMACQLDAIGRPPEVLAMLDCVEPGTERRQVRQRLKAFAYRWMVRARIKQHPPAVLPSKRIQVLLRTSHRAAQRHRPGTTTAPAMLLTTAERRDAVGDALLGWGPFLLGPIHSVEFDCQHLQLVGEHAASTAAAVERALSERDARHVQDSTLDFSAFSAPA